MLIYKVDNGVFYSYLYMKSVKLFFALMPRTSDAVALAIRVGAPIFIYEDILKRNVKTGESATGIINPNFSNDDLRKKDALDILKSGAGKSSKE